MKIYSPQNAINCTIYKKNSWGSMPPNPLATARSFAARDMTLCGINTKNPKNIKLAPLRNPAYAPAAPEPPSFAACISPNSKKSPPHCISIDESDALQINK